MRFHPIVGGVSTATMGTRDDRAWERIRDGLLRGVLIGAIAGALLGLILGAIAFGSVGAISAAVVAGVVGVGGLGAFWGVLAGLESPDPGHEPAQVERPLDVSELTSEEHDRRQRPA
jgi:hypothetical protein